MSSMFVSYRHQDSKPASAAVLKALTARFGADTVLCDVYSLRHGVDADQQLANTLGECSVLAAMIGPNWMSLSDASAHPQGAIKDNCLDEILFAMDRGIPVLTVLVDGARTPEPDELPKCLSAEVREQLERGFRSESFVLPVGEASFSDAIRRLSDILESYLPTQPLVRAVGGSHHPAATPLKTSPTIPAPSNPKSATSVTPQQSTAAIGAQGWQQSRHNPAILPPAPPSPAQTVGSALSGSLGPAGTGASPDFPDVQQLVDLIAHGQPFPIELADFWKGRLDVSRSVYHSLLPVVADRLAGQHGAPGVERFQQRYDAWLKSQPLMELNPDTLTSRAAFLQALAEVAARHPATKGGAIVRRWVDRFLTNIPQWHHELLNRALWSDEQRLALLEIYASRPAGTLTASMNSSLASSPLARAISLDAPSFPFPPSGAKSAPSLDPWLHLLAAADQVFSLGHSTEIAAWMRLRVLLAELGAHWASKPGLWQAPLGAPSWNTRANHLGEEIVESVCSATRLERASEDDMLAAWKRLSRLQQVVDRTFEWQVSNPRDRLAARFCGEVRRAMRNLTLWDSRRAKVRLPTLLPFRRSERRSEHSGSQGKPVKSMTNEKGDGVLDTLESNSAHPQAPTANDLSDLLAAEAYGRWLIDAAPQAVVPPAATSPAGKRQVAAILRSALSGTPGVRPENPAVWRPLLQILADEAFASACEPAASRAREELVAKILLSVVGHAPELDSCLNDAALPPVLKARLLTRLIQDGKPLPVGEDDFWKGRLAGPSTGRQQWLSLVADRLVDTEGAAGLRNLLGRYKNWLNVQPAALVAVQQSRASVLQPLCDVARKHPQAGATAAVQQLVDRFLSDTTPWHHDLLNTAHWSPVQCQALCSTYAERPQGSTAAPVGESLLVEWVRRDLETFPNPPLGVKTAPGLKPWLALLEAADSQLGLGCTGRIAAWKRLLELLTELPQHWAAKPNLWRARFEGAAWEARTNQLGDQISRQAQSATGLEHCSEVYTKAALKRLGMLQQLVNNSFSWDLGRIRDPLAAKFVGEVGRTLRELGHWNSKRAKILVPRFAIPVHVSPKLAGLAISLCLMVPLAWLGLIVWKAHPFAQSNEREKQAAEEQRWAKAAAEKEAQRLEEAEAAKRLAVAETERQRQKEQEERRVAEAKPPAEVPKMPNQPPEAPKPVPGTGSAPEKNDAPDAVILALLQVAGEEIRQLDGKQRRDLKGFQTAFDRLQTFAMTPPPLLRFLISPIGTIHRREEHISSARDAWKIGGKEDLRRIHTLLCKARDPAYCEALAVMLANKAKILEPTPEGFVVGQAWLTAVVNNRRVVNVTDLSGTDALARKRLADRLLPRLADEVQKGLLSQFVGLEGEGRKLTLIEEFERQSAEHYICVLLDVETARLKQLKEVRAAAISARKPHFIDLKLPLPTDDVSTEIPTDFHVISVALHGLKELSAIRHASDASPSKTVMEPVYRWQWNPVGLNELQEDNWSADSGRPLVLKSVPTPGAAGDVLKLLLPTKSKGVVMLTIPRNTSPKHGEELQLTVLELFGADPLTGAPRSEWHVLSGNKPVLFSLMPGTTKPVALIPQLKILSQQQWKVPMPDSGLIALRDQAVNFGFTTAGTAGYTLTATAYRECNIERELVRLLKSAGEEAVPTYNVTVRLITKDGALSLYQSAQDVGELRIALRNEARGLTKLEGLLNAALAGKVGSAAAAAWTKSFNEIILKHEVTNVASLRYYPIVEGMGPSIDALNVSNRKKAVEELTRASKQIPARKAEVKSLLESAAASSDDAAKGKSMNGSVGVFLDAWRVIADEEIAGAKIELPLWSRSQLPVVRKSGRGMD